MKIKYKEDENYDLNSRILLERFIIEVNSEISAIMELINFMKKQIVEIYYPQFVFGKNSKNIKELDIDLTNISTLNIRLKNLSGALNKISLSDNNFDLKKFYNDITDDIDIIDELKSNKSKLNTPSNSSEKMEKSLFIIRDLIAKILNIIQEEKSHMDINNYKIERKIMKDDVPVKPPHRDESSKNNEEKTAYQIDLFKKRLNDLITSEQWKSLISIVQDQNINFNQEFLFSKLFDKNNPDPTDRERTYTSIYKLNDINNDISQNADISLKLYCGCIKDIKKNIEKHFSHLDIQSEKSKTKAFILNELSYLKKCLKYNIESISLSKTYSPNDQHPAKRRRILGNYTGHILKKNNVNVDLSR